ncbi:MAG: NAD(P)H-dependent oxidoreductase [Bdellovibrionota bacterium]
MKAIPPGQLVEALEWRYSAKSFDPAKKIPAEALMALENSLVLTASSYGLQPWVFFIVEDPALREKLKSASWNQRQVTECSHYVVFAQKTGIDDAYVDRFLESMAATRGVSVDSLAGLRKGILGDVIHGERSRYISEWAARQVYIALGNLLTSAALIGVDTCPMEGFDPVKYDEILALPAQGLRATVACALGFRNPEDRFSTFKKVRFSRDELIRKY